MPYRPRTANSPDPTVATVLMPRERSRVDAAGDGSWAVALRCAEISEDGMSARLVAGGGIVADSDPLAELAETQAKFQAMLSAIVRP